MNFGIFDPFQVPPFPPLQGARKRMRDILWMEYQTLVFLERFQPNTWSIVREIYRIVPPELMKNLQGLSAHQLCYIWDLIFLTRIFVLEHPQGLGDTDPETIVFFLYLYHLADIHRIIRENYLEITPTQLVSLRYLPLQGITWVKKAGQGFTVWGQDPNLEAIQIAQPEADILETVRILDLLDFIKLGWTRQYAKSVRPGETDLFLVYPLWTIGNLCLYFCEKTHCLNQIKKVFL